MKRTPRTQTTRQGTEIPVPKRGDVLRDLRKASAPTTPKPPPSEDDR